MHRHQTVHYTDPFIQSLLKRTVETYLKKKKTDHPKFHRTHRSLDYNTFDFTTHRSSQNISWAQSIILLNFNLLNVFLKLSLAFEAKNYWISRDLIRFRF